MELNPYLLKWRCQLSQSECLNSVHPSIEMLQMLKYVKWKRMSGVKFPAVSIGPAPVIDTVTRQLNIRI